MAKFKFFLVLFVCFLMSSTIGAQNQELHYSSNSFYFEKDSKTHWKKADHLFEHDQELLDKYIGFRKAKKTANGLGVACLAQAVTGIGLIYIPGGRNCEFICHHQAVGIILLLITAPVTGLVGIVVAGVASGRKSKLVYLYDRQGMSTIKGLNKHNSEISLSIKGLGVGLTYSF